MIRRKMWATATFCLAIAGIAQAQTTAPQATLGKPQPDSPGYVARGASPNPGYPSFVPRNYTAPPAPTYAAPAAQPAPASGASMLPMTLDAKPAATLGTLPSAGESTFAIDTITSAPAPVMTIPASGPVTGPVVPGVPNGCGAPNGCGTTTGCAPYLDSACAPMPTCWFSAEWLKWRMKGVGVFPLVTAAPPGAPGTLDDPRTVVVYGGDDILTDWQTGYRIRAGMWFEGGTSGLDVGYFNVGKLRDTFVAGSTGNPGIFRPFFNTTLNTEDAQLIAFVDPVAGPVLSGAVSVFSETELMGAEVNYRSGWGNNMGGRVDALCGYRYLRLHDTINIQNNLTTQAAAGAAPAGTRIFSSDQFETTNQFHGLQAGLVGEWQFGQVTFGVRGTVAAGVTLQRVEISGGSGSVTPAGVTVSAPGGLLALPTNIGTYDRTRWSIAPELGVTVGYQIMDNIRIFAGYNVLYWTNVARAGEQMNRFVNATFIPDPTTGTATPTGSPSPLFHTRDESFWAHGCSLGIEFRW